MQELFFLCFSRPFSFSAAARLKGVRVDLGRSQRYGSRSRRMNRRRRTSTALVRTCIHRGGAHRSDDWLVVLLRLPVVRLVLVIVVHCSAGFRQESIIGRRHDPRTIRRGRSVDEADVAARRAATRTRPGAPSAHLLATTDFFLAMSIRLQRGCTSTPSCTCTCFNQRR